MPTQTKLQAIHCFFIGRVAKLRKKYTLAVEWLMEAKRLGRRDGTVDTPTVDAELKKTINEVKQLKLRHTQEFKMFSS